MSGCRVERKLVPVAPAAVAVHGGKSPRVVGRGGGKGGGEGADVGVAVAGRVAGVAHVEWGSAVNGVTILWGRCRKRSLFSNFFIRLE